LPVCAGWCRFVRSDGTLAGRIELGRYRRGPGEKCNMSESLSDQQQRKASSTHPTNFVGRKVLLVDDEPSYRDSLGHILSHERYDVRTASNAKSAMDVTHEFVPDILIVDWMLRDEMDGVQVAQSLRSMNPGLKTIFITGYRTPRLENQMREVPFAQFLSKPFSLDDFLEAVRLAAVQIDSTTDPHRA
jgi:two-component system, cell cycle sensor histidine kinase and response regulator CckA